MTTFDEIHNAFLYVCSAEYGMNRAFLCLDNGEIYYQSEWDDPKDEDEFECDHFIPIPHKNELNLGQMLVIEFAEEHLPDDLNTVRRIFGRRGAYRQLKDLFDERGLLQTWYDYEKARQREALREWAKDNEIELES